MDKHKSRILIESLRKGIPPEGHVREFTVGRKREIEALQRSLHKDGGTVMLLKANYGSGKTHLLRFIKEEALESGFAVSTVTVDSHSAVRFNRMDQIFGAVCRGIEVPNKAKEKGLRPFFNFIADSYRRNKSKNVWKTISNNNRWDRLCNMRSEAVFMSLRGWLTEDPEIEDIIEDWLYQSWEYNVHEKQLYLIEQLVNKISSHYYANLDSEIYQGNYMNNLILYYKNYHQTWEALHDLDYLSRAAGLKGLIILFDEYEDVITNLRVLKYQLAAFKNLFKFYGGESYTGKTFFAVTPQFSIKCKEQVLIKCRYPYDASQFDRLPTFNMSPLEVPELETLAWKIFELHASAYNWDPSKNISPSDISGLIYKESSVRIEDRTRHIIISVVKTLDNIMRK